VQQVKEVIPKEKQRALKCRDLVGGKPKAMEALKHAKIMDDGAGGGALSRSRRSSEQADDE
jgi:hypothetical protein